jgi:3-methylcrotonyl-CoA carboxylase alpha subunit
VRLADEAHYLGPSKAQESYLSVQKIMDIAMKLKVDAIHPGFGFLSENENFAQQVIDRNIVWIGPKPNLIKSMGNKDIARELALKSNIPICPGISNITKLNSDDLKNKCESIGYPLLVKSSAGGGGIGMSVVQNFKDLSKSIEKTSNMAEKSFGNGDVFIEKFITNARHIEIQIFGFGDKGSVHLYERDCSMQRRYQKIIEESPAPEIDRTLIESMANAAVKLSSDVKYQGAGTVEFIYDVEQKKYYFLEMNTRIQVEHPVTELVTNNDLVSMQINFAFNRKNKFLKQEKISIYGHSIECRVYAEDPSKNFLPSPGKISKLTFPKVPNGIRLDWGYDENDDVSFYYDPMIGKIISHDLVREDAVSKLINFLEKIVLKGIKTNIPFLISLLKDKNFINGTHNTKYIENNLNTLTSKINSDKNTLSEVAIDKKRIKIVETDKLKIVNNRSETETGGIKVVYFD